MNILVGDESTTCITTLHACIAALNALGTESDSNMVRHIVNEYDANLAPGRTKAEKRKAKKARKRAKALAATGESTSTDSAACTTDGATDAHAKPSTGTGAGSRGTPANKTCYSCGENVKPVRTMYSCGMRNTNERKKAGVDAKINASEKAYEADDIWEMNHTVVITDPNQLYYLLDSQKTLRLILNLSFVKCTYGNTFPAAINEHRPQSMSTGRNQCWNCVLIVFSSIHYGGPSIVGSEVHVSTGRNQGWNAGRIATGGNHEGCPSIAVL